MSQTKKKSTKTDQSQRVQNAVKPGTRVPSARRTSPGWHLNRRFWILFGIWIIALVVALFFLTR